MGYYTENKAVLKQNPVTNQKARLQGDVTSGVAKTDVSKQILATDDKPYKVPSKVRSDAGNQVQVTGNQEGTGEVKDPLGAYQSKDFAPDSNPDRGRDRTTKKKAALANPSKPKL